jgi:hypothetical protein
MTALLAILWFSKLQLLLHPNTKVSEQVLNG